MRNLAVVIVLALSAWGTPCGAEVVVTLDSAVIPIGGAGTINVTIAALDQSESFGLLDLEFLTSPNPLANLWFREPQNESYLTDPNYVFRGNSESLATNQPATSNSEGIRLKYLDSTADDSNVLLNSGETRLVATLQFEHFGESEETFFIDITGWVRKADGTPIQYRRNFGRVDVVAVPEPASGSALVAAAGTVAFCSRTRRRNRISRLTRKNRTV